MFSVWDTYKGSGPAVSVMIPSRGRPQQLKRAIDSLYQKARNPEKVEVVVRIDDDDQKTLEFLASATFPALVLCGPRRRGYLDLHHFIHEMAAAAQGKWLMAFNDDAVVISQNWDRYFHCTIIEDEVENLKDSAKQYFLDDIWLLQPMVVGRYESNEFFAVTRRTFEILGHLSLNMGMDLWLDAIFKTLHRVMRVHLLIEHETKDDQTFQQGRDTIKGEILRELTTTTQVVRGRLRDTLILLDYIDHVQEHQLNPFRCEKIAHGSAVYPPTIN